jgi:probable F420-dependent oxidoreductase
VNFGFCLPSEGALSRPDSLIRIAQKAEELGFQAISFSDHIVIPEKIGAPYPYTADHKIGFPPECLEQLTALSFLAAKTKNVRLLTSIMVVPHRNPLVAAKMLATLDVLSGGRVIAGVGTGWLEDEFVALGLPPFKDRGEVSDEYIKVYRELWKDGVSSFDGKYARFSGVVLAPKPVQRPGIPIWVGGESRRAMERAARSGDGWYPTPNNADRPMRTLEQLSGAVEVFHSLVDSASRSRKEVSIGLGDVKPHLDGKRNEGDLFSGPADKIRDDVAKCESLGVQYLGMNIRGGSVDETIRNMERFATEVIAK